MPALFITFLGMAKAGLLMGISWEKGVLKSLLVLLWLDLQSGTLL